MTKLFTSVRRAELSQLFFATVQNKMHWATHGHTAAEIVHVRADATKPFMGMQSTRAGGIVRKEDAAIAKNYLTESELQVLNRIVSLYIEYAELQALERKPMTMQDWITKLDEFMKVSGRKLLDHAGAVSAEAAKTKAEQEYTRYHALLDAKPRAIDAEMYNRLPEFLVVRECFIRVEQPGFRVRTLIVATTLLEADQYSKDDLAPFIERAGTRSWI